jgi:hypothetical protein
MRSLNSGRPDNVVSVSRCASHAAGRSADGRLDGLPAGAARLPVRSDMAADSARARGSRRSRMPVLPYPGTGEGTRASAFAMVAVSLSASY